MTFHDAHFSFMTFQALKINYKLWILYSTCNQFMDSHIIKCCQTYKYYLIKMTEFQVYKYTVMYVNRSDKEIYSPLTERMMPWRNTFGCQFKFTVWFVQEWLSSLCGNWKGEPVSIGSLNRVFSLRWKLCSLTFPWKAVTQKQTMTIKGAQSQ